MNAKTPRRRPHFVYLLRCGDRTYYIGYTTDPARRLAAHRAGRGAQYTRGRGPVRLVALWRVPALGSALRLEYRLKQLPRAIKHRLAQGLVPESLRGVLRPAVVGRAVTARVRRTR
ncbi:MAG: GIY-YIG nuclease family protein [bacterium]